MRCFGTSDVASSKPITEKKILRAEKAGLHALVKLDELDQKQ